MKKQLTGKELIDKAENLQVSLDGLYSNTGIIDEVELRKRVREAEDTNPLSLTKIVLLISTVVGIIAGILTIINFIF